MVANVSARSSGSHLRYIANDRSVEGSTLSMILAIDEHVATHTSTYLARQLGISGSGETAAGLLARKFQVQRARVRSVRVDK